MASVEELLVRLDATTAGLRQELRRADTEISGFESRTNRRLQSVDSRFDKLGNNIARRFVPQLVAAFSAKSIGGNIMAFERVEARLKRLTDGSADYAQTQVYLRKKGDAAGPVKTSRDFRRLHFNAGQTQQVIFEIAPKQMEWWDEQSKVMQVQAGEYELLVGKSSADEDLKTVAFTIK